MVNKDEFPRPIETPETLTRGDAMIAANRWFEEARGEAARRAYLSQFSKNEDQAYKTALNKWGEFTELPCDSPYPTDAEKVWRIRVRLHAQAVDINVEQASQSLRADFTRYLGLLYAFLAQWQNDCLVAGKSAGIPMDDSLMELSYFCCNECAQDPFELFDKLKRLHANYCELCQGK